MGATESRLSKIERALDQHSGICSCADWERVYYKSPILPSQNGVKLLDVCPKCGGTIQALEIVYVEDWRGFRAT